MDDDKVVSLSHREKIFIDDPLTEVLRSGASRLLVCAVEAEVQAFLAAHEHRVDDEGRQRIVRHGYMPGARRSDRDRPSYGASPPGARSPVRRGGRADPLHLGAPAALSPPRVLDRGVAAVALQTPGTADYRASPRRSALRY